MQILVLTLVINVNEIITPDIKSNNRCWIKVDFIIRGLFLFVPAWFYLLQDMLVLVEGMKFCVAMTKTKVRVKAGLLNSNRHQVIPRNVSWIRIASKLFRQRSHEFE